MSTDEREPVGHGHTLVMFHEIVEKNGKTIRENNMEKHHRLHEGQEVRVYTCDGEDDPLDTIDHVHTDDCPSHVAFVLRCGRDCDGTPLYWLGAQASWHEMVRKGASATFDNMGWRILNNVQGGYGEDSVEPSDVINEILRSFNF